MNFQLPEVASFGLVAINIVMVAILIMLTYKGVKSPYKLSLKVLIITHALILSLAIFDFYSGDYYHYYNIMYKMERRIVHMDFSFWDASEHMEMVYWYIAMFVKFNYFWFRVIVWGSAYFIFLLLIKRLDLKMGSTLAAFICFPLMVFCYARVTLAMVIAFYGFSYIVKKPKYLNYVFSVAVGIFIIFLSGYFHKSAVLLWAVFPFALMKINRKNIVLMIILLPLFSLAINLLGVDYFMDMNDGDATVEKFQNYMTRTSNSRSLGGLIYEVLQKIPYLLSCYFFIIILRKRIYLPPAIAPYVNLVLFLTVIYVTLLLPSSYNTSTIANRILFFSALPIACSLGYIIPIVKSKYLKFIYLSGVVYTFYQLLYISLAAYNGNLH